MVSRSSLFWKMPRLELNNLMISTFREGTRDLQRKVQTLVVWTVFCAVVNGPLGPVGHLQGTPLSPGWTSTPNLAEACWMDRPVFYLDVGTS